MKLITTAEMLQLRELLQMETTALAKAKVTEPFIEDHELKDTMKIGIQAVEARLKGIQQFISDNNIMDMEVH